MLRIASYNIHRCFGCDGEYQPERIKKVLNMLDANIIALQEVESGAAHGDLLQFLVQDSNWKVIEGVTMDRTSGRYGNALLTSLPVESVSLKDLSQHDREPRGAIDVRVQYHGRLVRVIATHLGLKPSERRAQTRQLLDWIGPPQQSAATTTVLMGDLNEWFLWGRPARWLRSWFSPTPAPATYPSRWPVFALDRIWVSPRRQLIKTEVIRNQLTKLASDHCPVVASLKPE